MLPGGRSGPQRHATSIIAWLFEYSGQGAQGHGIDQRLFNAVLAQEDLASSPLVEHYRSRGAEPVICDAEALKRDGFDVMQAPLQGARPTATLRHDPRSLALAVMRFYRKHRKEQNGREG